LPGAARGLGVRTYVLRRIGWVYSAPVSLRLRVKRGTGQQRGVDRELGERANYSERSPHSLEPDTVWDVVNVRPRARRPSCNPLYRSLGTPPRPCNLQP
jgi:hypothetical protein